MKIRGIPYRTIWLNEDGWRVNVIDQTKLPHEFSTITLSSDNDVAHAIRTMIVRGAPLIGAAAAFGICLAMREDATNSSLVTTCKLLSRTRPTAVNLHRTLNDMKTALMNVSERERVATAYTLANDICLTDIKTNQAIGEHGFEILRKLYTNKPPDTPLNILTHCNAGWLATVDWGTATAPMYSAHNAGLPIHVWVDETRPRNQGSALTAFELAQHGVPHTVIVDNAGGHLMQNGEIDLCLVGTDRTTASGDVANKIGTYLKALAAKDNNIPFYVALPSSTIDWSITDDINEIPIEERSKEEVMYVSGRDEEGRLAKIQVTPDGSNIANYAFDVTPARLITGLITERGMTEPSAEGLATLFPEHVTQDHRTI